jgi:hypothetical protein
VDLAVNVGLLPCLRSRATILFQFLAPFTPYDLNTRTLVQNKEQRADRSSRQPDLLKNSDGSAPPLQSDRDESFREELDCGRAGPGVVRVPPPLCARGSLPRQDVEAAGHREGVVVGWS